MQSEITLQRKMLVGGEWVEARKSFPVINPATELVIAEAPRGDAEDVDRAVRAAEGASAEWAGLHPSERGRLLYKLAASVQEHAPELALIETMEMGRPLHQSVAGMRGVIDTIEYNAGAADKLQGETIPIGNSHIDITLREPLGVTAHIIPWNAPMGMAVRSMAPALAVGCTVVVKPAEQSPFSLLRMAELAKEIGFPDGVINIVTGFGDEVGEPMITHPHVRGITFTGSVETGKRVMALAATGIKPVVLELGGKNPLIVFPDADLERVIAVAARGILTNCGQVCVAASRFIVHSAIHDRFVEALHAEFERTSVGDPLANPDMGPLVSQEQYDRVMRYIQTGTAQGARLVAGGHRPADFDRGFYVRPTLFDRVSEDMQIAQDEIFGPVAAVFAFDSEAEAVAIANGTAFGLAAGVFTQDISRALRVTRLLQAGIIWVNDWFAGGAVAPVGGYKESGIGRERGLAGLQNYLQTKNVAIRI